MATTLRRLRRLVLGLLDPRAPLHLVRILHFYNYSHVQPRRRMTIGKGARVAPNTSLRNGERISLGAGVHLNERVSLFAGDAGSRIDVGSDVLFGPGVFVTASNYSYEDRMTPIHEQPRREASVVIGDGCWLGANVVVLPGVTIGDGCVVAAGAVVTKDLEPWSIAAGVPAKVVGRRTE